jgi:hypothetical protein
MESTPEAPQGPETYEFERSWTVFVKPNETDWSPASFKNLTRISNIRELWEFLNADASKLTGRANVFVMEEGLVPLWEKHKDVFGRGGCWSTIVRGETWTAVLTEMLLALVGEIAFDEHDVKGVCVVPVGRTHSLIKLWTCSSSKRTAAALNKTLSAMRNVDARFKPFAA